MMLFASPMVACLSADFRLDRCPPQSHGRTDLPPSNLPSYTNHLVCLAHASVFASRIGNLDGTKHVFKAKTTDLPLLSFLTCHSSQTLEHGPPCPAHLVLSQRRIPFVPISDLTLPCVLHKQKFLLAEQSWQCCNRPGCESGKVSLIKLTETSTWNLL